MNCKSTLTTCPEAKAKQDLEDSFFNKNLSVTFIYCLYFAKYLKNFKAVVLILQKKVSI